jgi:hypothetical protein
MSFHDMVDFFQKGEPYEYTTASIRERDACGYADKMKRWKSYEQTSGDSVRASLSAGR